MEWIRHQHEKDPSIWLEIAREGDTAHLRAPVAVVERMYRMGTEYGYVPRSHFISQDEEDGKVRHIAGTCKDMARFIETAKKNGPGPLERMFMDMD